MTSRTTRRSFIASGASVLLLAGCVAPSPGTAPATAPEGRRRTIPFSLWAGEPSATPDRPVRVTRGDVTISGPVDWVHPATGETLRVWERSNRERDGLKLQRFAIRSDGYALSRVFDSRPGRADRVFLNDAFFPLGVWEEGERRDFPLTEIEGDRRSDYVATLRIVRIDQDFRDVPGSLRHDWTLRDRAGRIVFDERFDHSPGKGLVRFRNLRA
jgi:hypothetical protein